MSLPVNQIVQGDCITVLSGFPENSIDCVVTDPPYGLNFMGKDWDQALPSKDAFSEIYRVLKPGGLAFVMSSPRQDLLWRMCSLLEGVGFELSQSFICWIYKTGFPKAYDVSKGIDKKLGLEREITGYTERFGRENRKSEKVGFGGSEIYGNGLAPNKIPTEPPVSVDAEKWDGWKARTGLKPALEPILMVNKPMSENSIVDNVLRWGTGAMNVDACRIPFKGEDDKRTPYRKDGTQGGSNAFHGQNEWGKSNDFMETQKGRFPANLLVSDDALNDGELTKTGTIDPHHVIKGDGEGHQANKVYGKYGLMPSENHVTYGDEGSKSRFFDLDAWAVHHGFLDVAKPDTKERDFGLKGKKKEVKTYGVMNPDLTGNSNNTTGQRPAIRRNIHPTVKPIKLMAYLIELGCPKNGVILDPFVGSGTTCIAAKQLQRKYIGIEMDQEYHALAVSRVAAYPQPLEWFGENVLKRERT